MKRTPSAKELEGTNCGRLVGVPGRGSRAPNRDKATLLLPVIRNLVKKFFLTALIDKEHQIEKNHQEDNGDDEDVEPEKFYDFHFALADADTVSTGLCT